MKKLPNIHPGEVLNTEFLLPLGISQNALARAMGVPPRRVNEIVLGKRGISADTAVRLTDMVRRHAASLRSLTAFRTSSAASFEDAGFWPVISNPSCTVCTPQSSVEENSAPCSRSTSSSR
ncbi:HigA family addiction module antitoxin [Luteimonas suaedae]|uniref:HigA family addiction module antitoxin n=1 Tax=Luteimonas suaedae TaxID=2605430 RepID=UPI003CCCDADC